MVELSGQEESVFGESVTEIPESMELFHSMIIVVKEEVQKKKKRLFILIATRKGSFEFVKKPCRK